MSDQSALDKKYFIDNHVYNCPFCNRRNVSYDISEYGEFDWTNEKKCYFYMSYCDSCGKEAFHLSFTDLELKSTGLYATHKRFAENIDNLDSYFFYSVPTSFFSLNDNIPKIIRELIIEAEGCLKSNFLTGASACIRKIVYELTIIEKGSGENYEDRIKSLKKIFSKIDSTYFDTLLTIQQLTSNKVHENSYDNWESKYIKLILATIHEILNEIYVIPKLRKEKRSKILELKEKVLGKKENTVTKVVESERE